MRVLGVCADGGAWRSDGRENAIVREMGDRRYADRYFVFRLDTYFIFWLLGYIFRILAGYVFPILTGYLFPILTRYVFPILERRIVYEQFPK